MTGPEHYQEAERELRNAHESDSSVKQGYHVAAAQAHATLALAAAQAFNCDCVAGEWGHWVEVAASEETKQDRL